MRIKTVILVSNEHRKETGIYILCRDGKTPAPIRRRESPQKLSVSIDGNRRTLARAQEIERSRQISKREDSKDEHRRCKEKTRDLTKVFHVKHFGKEMARDRTN